MSVRRKIVITYLAFILIFAGLICLSVWIGKLIADPVNALSLAAVSIEQGSYKLKRPPSLIERQDEFGLLARVFHRMADEIHTREQNLKQQIQPATYQNRS